MNAIVAEPQQQILRLIQRIDGALALEPANPRFLLHRAQCLLALGRAREACDAAQAAYQGARSEPVLLDAIGTLFSQANEHERALQAYDRAIASAPNQPPLLFNRAAVRRFLGQLAEAEQDYDRVIALKPDDYEAYKNRAELRTQTREHNHIVAIETLLARGISNWTGEVELRYALAKEYEDLGEYEKSFSHLQRGSQLRREHLRYDVATDVATAGWIIEAFPGPASAETTNGTVGSAQSAARDFANGAGHPPARDSAISAAHPTVRDSAIGAGHPPARDFAIGAAHPPARESGTPAPIFIVGLPRSGSTLVDRILGSHSKVRSAGELPHFALALVDGVRRQTGIAQLPRKDLVARSANLSFAALGRDYLARVRAGGMEASCFTDKMPLNYLYCGLIQRALPAARIVHVVRAPMASCYAMYKTLFRDGYPFSYDFAELARYYAAYRRLMQHWETTLPGRIHLVRYEDLVSDQIGTTRRLLEFCGLQWEDSCAQFHNNPSPTTTASASQVRRSLYNTSVSQWRSYAQQLAPLQDHLTAAGINCDE